MGRNLQKEIAEIKEEVSNSEFILKAKSQRIKELKIKLNDLDSIYDSLNLQLNKTKKNYNTLRGNIDSNNLITDSALFSTDYNQRNLQNKFDINKSLEFNILNTNTSNNLYLWNNNNNTKSIPNDIGNYYDRNIIKDKYYTDLHQSNILCNISSFSDTSMNKKENSLNNYRKKDNQSFSKLILKNKKINEMHLDQVLEESEKCLGLKKDLEKSISELQKLINQKQLELSKLLSEFEEEEEIYEKLEEEYGYLKIENIKNDKRRKKLINFLENHEIFIKNFESGMNILKYRIEINKSLYEKLEKEMILKLYFVRFSNSMVRSLFNIINIRRLHIEMIKIFSKKEMEVYSNLFKKLDDAEFKIINEYHEFLNFIKKEENIGN
jgi:hypothetical protein